MHLKSEPIDEHCHCVNAQQQSFEYLDDIERSGISKSTEALSASTKEILIQEKPEDIWNIVNKGYRIPDPKKKWAKKVVKNMSVGTVNTLYIPTECSKELKDTSTMLFKR